MKTTAVSIMFVAGTLAGISTAGLAQESINQPNPVISSPQPSAGTPNQTATPQTTGGRLSSAPAP